VICIPFCPSCGSNVDSDKRFCENCGAPLATVPANTPPPPPPPQAAYVPPVQQAPVPQTPAQQKSVGLAAVASFFIPGLGQTYNGSFGKGLLLLFGTIIGSMIFTIPGIIVWLYGMYDAYTTASRMNEGKIAFVPHSTMSLIGFVAIAIVILIIYVAVLSVIALAMSAPYYY